MTCEVSVSDAPEVTMKHVQLSAPGKITASSKSSDAGSRQHSMLALIYIGRKEGLSVMR